MDSISLCNSSRLAFLRRVTTSPSRLTGRRFSVSSTAHAPSSKVVTISYDKLQDRRFDLSKEIEAGFGPNGLGIISISQVPNYSVLRENLLYLSHRLGALSEEAKRDLEDPQSRFSFGWSHGKEKLESGQPDKWKGSFYANPIVDVPTTDEDLRQRYKTYCRPNLWPKKVLPQLEPAFKDLGKLIFNIGLLLSYHCDKYVLKQSSHIEVTRLEPILQRSLCHKGRLLHYFPVEQSEKPQQNDDVSSWCGWHTDHSALTGLTYPMYIKDCLKICSDDNEAGLYIKSRSGEITKAIYEKDNIAYQVGEAAEILSDGFLHATPHCVKTPKGQKAVGVERNTFALFMQPNWDESFQNLDMICKLHNEVKSQLSSSKNVTFGDYSEMLLNKYYNLQSK